MRNGVQLGLNADLLDDKHAKDFAPASSVHAPVTLGAGSDAALSLSGQELTLANVLTPSEGDAAYLKITGATAGATTQPQAFTNGLQGTLTVKNPEPVYDVELLTNGAFTGNANGWELDAGWTYYDNNVIHETLSGGIRQSFAATPGSYELALTVGGSAGTLGVYADRLIATLAGGSGAQTIIFQNYITATVILELYADAAFDGTLDDISLRRVTLSSAIKLLTSNAAIEPEMVIEADAGTDVVLRATDTADAALAWRASDGTSDTRISAGVTGAQATYTKPADGVNTSLTIGDSAILRGNGAYLEIGSGGAAALRMAYDPDTASAYVDLSGLTEDRLLIVPDLAGTLALAPIARTITVSETPYTALADDYTLRCNCAGGALTVYMPAASGSGRILNIKKLDSSANAVTVTADGSDTIDGAATQTVSGQYDNMQIQDGAAGEWDII